MEINYEKLGKGRVRGQMFSLTALIFVLLMVATLLIFVSMGISYDSLSESSSLSSSSTNYGLILSRSASAFAYSSGTSAMSTLFKYEYNSSMRGTNFISNLSEYMTYLMVNGTLPNVPPGTSSALAIYNMMGQQTFASYNAQVSSITGFSSKQVNITETKPQIFQANPYSINVEYTEDVIINTSVGRYSYEIPINVSLPLNNTPDLFYAQQGVYKPISFAGVQGLAGVIGGDYAHIGSSTGFIYGTIYQIPSGANNCNSVPATLSAPPYNSQIIIVTVNAIGITGLGGCANLYGGLITQSISLSPSIPYLIFAPSSNALRYLQTGQQALLYGPGMSVLNISNLINKVSSESYFTSPFASSYSDRVAGDFERQSPNGIFTFFGFDRQAAQFNGHAQIVTKTSQTGVLSYSVAAWVYPRSLNGVIENTNGGGSSESGSSLTLGIGNPNGCGNPPGTFYFGDTVSGTGIGVNSLASYPSNTWYFVVGTFNSIGGSVKTSQFTLYVNGNLVQTGPGCTSLASDSAPLTGGSTMAISPISSYLTANFIGSIANLQVYSESLTPSQVYSLYSEGIETLPISNSPLLGWYTLNGNPNGYIGSQSPASVQGVTYSLLSNYTRDQIFVSAITTNTFPIPGLLTCANRAQCYSSTTPSIYIGDLPLTIGNAGISAAYLNGQSSNILIIGTVPTSNVISASAWVNLESTLAAQYSGEEQQRIIGSGNFIMSVNALGNGEADYSVKVGGSWQSVSSSFPLAKDTWYSLIGTYGLSTSSPNYLLTLYVNGNQVNQVTVSSGAPLPANQQPTSIGSCTITSSNVYYFNGTISNIQVYNSTLSAQQAGYLYQAGIGGAPVDTKHIVGWWPLNGNTKDYSGYANSASVATSLSYVPIQSNYSQAFYSYNSLGLSSIRGISNEWQSLGFPAHP